MFAIVFTFPGFTVKQQSPGTDDYRTDREPDV